MTLKEKREYNRIWMRNWRKNNPERNRELAKKYRKKYIKSYHNLKKERARRFSYIETFFSDEKDKKCIICGSKKIHTHHLNYDRPLDVVFLCPSHHSQVHSGLLTLDNFQNNQ